MATLTPLRLLFFSVFMCYLLQLEQAQVSAKPTIGFTSNSSTVFEMRLSIKISIERTGNMTVDTTVTVYVTAGTATRGIGIMFDYYVFSPTSVTFRDDAKTEFVSLRMFDDQVVENVETIVLAIQNDTSAFDMKAGFSTHTVYIKDTDVSINCTSTPVSESAGTALVKITRSGSPEALNYTHSIRCNTTEGTALSPTDYQSKTSENVSFAQNVLIKNFPVNLTNDRVVEGNESFSVTCTTSDPRVVVEPSCSDIQINIINDDTYVYFCPGYSTSIEENVGSYTVRLCRVGVLEDTQTVKLCRSSDSVSPLHDYPAVQTRCYDIVFTAYDEVKELVIPVTNDKWGEQEYKTFNISMNTTDAGVTFNDTTSYVVTIHDDDNRITEQEAQELLVRRRKILIILGVACAFLALAVILFLCCICYLLRQQICSPGDFLLSK